MTTQHSTVVGVFNDTAQAERAVAQLKRAGFRDEDIQITVPQQSGLRTEAKPGDSHVAPGTTSVAGLHAGHPLTMPRAAETPREEPPQEEAPEELDTGSANLGAEAGGSVMPFDWTTPKHPKERRTKGGP